MKEKVKVVKDEALLPEKIRITDIPKLQEVLGDIWLDAVKKDYKELSKEDLCKKYDIKEETFEITELIIDDTKREEYKKWLDSLKKKPKYID